MTSVSLNPLKALLFAKECAFNHPNDAVIYIARIESLSHLPQHGNVLEDIEEEIALEIKPEDFYKLCDGYVKIAEFMIALRKHKIPCSDVVRIENLTKLCGETGTLSQKFINQLVEEIRDLIKKV